MLKEFFVYRQEFQFKVSYMIINPKQYIPGGAKFVGRFQAESRKAAAAWLKNVLDHALSRLNR